MKINVPPLPLKGGCQCGQLRFRITAEPETLYCCHCTDCQAQSASAFGMSMRVPADGVEIDGKTGSNTRDPGQETATEGVFCPECGCRVAHLGGGSNSGASVKAGSLDDVSWLQPVGHIWTRSAQKWMQFEGLIYETQPEDEYAALIEAFQTARK